jgi:carbonic anhydrase
MKSFEKLLLENKAWASEKLELDPEYFRNQMHDQSPEFFWIGCSAVFLPMKLPILSQAKYSCTET